MLIARQEMRRLFGRFVLLTGAIALLVILLLFFQSVGGSLTTGQTGLVDQNSADLFVYSDKARKNPAASFMTTNAVDAVSQIDGVAQAAGVGLASFSPQGSDATVSVVGLQDLTFGGPRTLSDGRQATGRGEAVASNPKLSASDLTLSIGDTITLEGVELSVVGLADDATYSSAPTVYAAFDDLQQMSETRAGAPVPPLLSWVAVKVADGADPATVAKAITANATFDPAAAFADMAPPGGIPGGPPGEPGAGGPPTATSIATTSVPVTSPAASTVPGTTPTTTATTGTAPAGTTPGISTPATTANTAAPATTVSPTTGPPTTAPASGPDGGADQPGGVGGPSGPGGPPPGVGDMADALSGLSGGVEAVDRATAAANLPGVGQISQSFGILNLLLYIVITIVTGVFFLILTVQKQDSLVLMRAMGASKNDAVKPVLIEVLVVVGVGSIGGVAIAASMLYLLRNTLGATLDTRTTVVSVIAILVLGIIASIASVRRVLSINPVQAARMNGE